MKANWLTSNWVQFPLTILLIFLLFFYLKSKFSHYFVESAKPPSLEEVLSKRTLPATTIEILNPQLKLGQVLNPADAYGYLKIVNTGPSDLLIDHVETSCDCTSSEYKTEKISPGDTLSLKISYIKRKVGYFYQDIMIYGNFPSSPLLCSIEGTFK